MTELRGVACRVGSHSVTCHPIQVNKLVLDFAYPGGMEGWVDLGDFIMSWLGIRLATSWSKVWCPNYCATKTALKRCSRLEILWYKKLVSRASPVFSEIILPRPPKVSIAIGSKMYQALRSTYFSSLRVAAISAAAPASRAALSMYDFASGHVTVTSQHNDLPLCQGTSVN